MRGAVHDAFENTTKMKQAHTAVLRQLLQAYVFGEILKEIITGLFNGREMMAR